MHLAGHKRMRYHNEDANYTYPSQSAVPANHVSVEERTSENGRDYSNVFAHSSLLQDDGKYGSVTKDVEFLHTKSMEMINYVSAIQKSFSSPSPRKLSEAPKITPSSPSPGCQQAKDLIDLEGLEEHENKAGNTVTSAIVLDSDDDEGSHPVLPSSSDRLRNFRAWLSSQIELRLRKNRLPMEAANSILPLADEQGITATEGRKLPSIQYEKVVLNVPDRQLGRVSSQFLLFLFCLQTRKVPKV